MNFDDIDENQFDTNVGNDGVLPDIDSEEFDFDDLLTLWNLLLNNHSVMCLLKKIIEFIARNIFWKLVQNFMVVYNLPHEKSQA